jgi:hypothetical protein
VYHGLCGLDCYCFHPNIVVFRFHYISVMLVLGSHLIALFLLLCIHFMPVDTITCRIGYGQRGRLYAEGLEWTRNCPNAFYCFEGISEDITVFQRLFDYHWDSYYNEFYVRSCGGDLGTPLQIRPFAHLSGLAKKKKRYAVPLDFSMNITTPKVITGQGSTEELVLKYYCRKDLCSVNSASKSHINYVIMAVSTVVAVSVLILVEF